MPIRHIAPLAAILVSTAAWGGKVSVSYLDIDEGLATALLEASSQRQIDAMRKLIAARHPGPHTARRWEAIETHMRTTPIARMEYHYGEGSAVRIRTYHAAGGEPLGRVANSAFEGDMPLSRPGTPDSPGWSDGDDPSSPRPSFTDEELAAAEAADESFYTGFDDTDIRAPFRAGGSSTMDRYWHEGRYHPLDAEQKALHAIEDDILANRVPAGGTVRGLLSSPLCATCQSTIERFAQTYSVDIDLTGMSPGIPVRTREALIRTGKARLKGLKLVDTVEGKPLIAFDVLDGARDAQVRQNLSPAALKRSSSGGLWQRRSFRLSTPRPSRISEGSDGGTDPAPVEPGASAQETPGC